MLLDWSRKHTLVLIFSIVLAVTGYLQFHMYVLAPKLEIIAENQAQIDTYIDSGSNIPDGAMELTTEDIEYELESIRSMSGEYNLVDTTIQEKESSENNFELQSFSSDMMDIDMFLNELGYNDRVAISNLLIANTDGKIGLNLDIVIR